MLALTKKTDYALIALAHLAKQAGDLVSARELARVSHVPLPILTNVLKTLAHAGIVVSERGASGGYSLARPARSISLHELIAVIEGPFHFVQCVPDESSHRGKCELEPCCAIRKPAQRVHGRLKVFLESVTLDELVGEQTVTVGMPAFSSRDL